MQNSIFLSPARTGVFFSLSKGLRALAGVSLAVTITAVASATFVRPAQARLICPAIATPSGSAATISGKIASVSRHDIYVQFCLGNIHLRDAPVPSKCKPQGSVTAKGVIKYDNPLGGIPTTVVTRANLKCN